MAPLSMERKPRLESSSLRDRAQAMKILLTGATGYIGKRLLPELVNKGHFVVCCARDVSRLHIPETLQSNVQLIETDFLKPDSLKNIPADIDAAYYLMHSMSTSADYDQLELQSARHFRTAMQATTVKQVIYLSGIANDHSLSKHLASRRAVEHELSLGTYHCTTLRAGVIIGSGSASYEIIRDLVEKLPVMIAPKWLITKCQPIAIRDVINFLTGVLFHPKTFDRSFDIGGPDILTYKEMLLGYAKVRGLRRWIYTVPVMTPRLSSYWLYFVTSTSFKLAASLVESMKVEVVCRTNELPDLLGIKPVSYEESLRKTLVKIEGEHILSSWKDSFVSGRLNRSLSDFLQVPTHGCFIDRRSRHTANTQKSIEKIWRIGGKNGWYFATWLWRLRGFIDKLCGGVGLRRGRTNTSRFSSGDAVDFWRVLHADKIEGRLLLFAEMKLPGEAWLELSVKENTLTMTATFRPKGVLGRLYWYAVYPLHGIIFGGMLRRLTEQK
jgi:uncharacterized protein YbjT (DUF2867 family)